MSEFAVKSVEDLCAGGVLFPPMDGNHGGMHPKATDYVPTGIPFIMASDLANGHVDTKSCAFITLDQANQLKKGFSIEGDVLLTHKATIGRSAIVGKIDYPFIMLTPQVTYYRVKNPSVLSNRYLFYYFSSKGFLDLFNQWSGAGSTRAYLGITGQRKLPIVLPPIEWQHQISEILASLDDKIKLNRRMNDTLEAMAQAIFRDWFVDFGPTRRKMEGATDPLSIMGGLVQDSGRAQALADMFPAALGDDRLPDGWRLGTLGDLAVSAGATVDPTLISADTPYIGLEHMPRKSITLSEWACASKVSSTKAKFEAGQILFGKLRPYFHKVGIAPVNGVCSTDIIVMDGKDTEERPLLNAIASSEEFVRFTDQSSIGTKMPRTSWGHMKTYPLAIASENVRREYGQITEPHLSKIVANIHENRTLAATRDLLLPKLMSGEIRLSEAEGLMEAAQ